MSNNIKIEYLQSRKKLKEEQIQALESKIENLRENVAQLRASIERDEEILQKETLD